MERFTRKEFHTTISYNKKYRQFYVQEFRTRRRRDRQFFRDHVQVGNVDKHINTIIPGLCGEKVKSLKQKGGKKGDRTEGKFPGEKVYATKRKLPFLTTKVLQEITQAVFNDDLKLHL